MALLNVDKLSVHFGDEGTPFRAVDRISYSVEQGQVVGIVGESGSGKSVSSLAIMGLIDFPGKVMADKLEFNGQDLRKISEKERRQLVGSEVAMIFQDPMTSLNPCYTVGYQIMEALKVHQGGNRRTRRQRAIDLLTQVGIPDPASRLDVYPHQLSGGMSQRVMIAMAIACRPKLLIADEPTTALDVTIQAQIIELLLDLQQRENMALLLITHDLALVAEAEALEESELPAPLANLIDQPGYKKVFKDIKAAIAAVSEQSGLSSELLASRRQINQLLNWHWKLKDGESRPELISGWRGDLLMAPLQDILKDY
ncbi:ATP-binding cassette domain-containing protein [Staphylococcus aureus]|uniref:ATP-binding cassette domain-containing protein n=1 Tax=Staphylococcus aureus TaxID=1280 RepID=UPI002723D61D|nr:ATP-binding cassette domain-containing protein [Staphylococcus aureus]MDO8220528.1 ATP-binding cassette domain-containing protein [Staphylococcus aureus]